MSEILGKINHSQFEDFLKHRCGKDREEVRVGPEFGVDVSVVDLDGEKAMALTSDPLSLIPSLGLEESAWLSVHLMANDMATTGFAPMFGQFVLNLPANLSKNDFEIYWNYIHQFCKEIGVTITGGHTGFIEGQNSTMAGGGTLITIAPKEKILVSKYAKPGDTILVTKTSALSSAAILAMSFPETVKNKIGKEFYYSASASFYETSSLKDALAAVQIENSGVTAMHDVTEGGVLGAIYELAVASGNGAEVFNEKLPIGDVQSAVCNLFSLDPRYCIGAGSMIITCKKDKASEIISRLELNHVPCTQVGTITEKSSGIKLIENAKANDLLYFEEDPYWKAFFNAYKNGWK
ncbi:AIR synthase family protein [Chryseobacterium chendengshani]|uniref:AIR synthase family protein n=1 Tax=Chryseobacterium sp. LJ668 TaxID=2864040 RepID=UPI001C689684|nr:AIR synthase family protein [Chryseobacterium sp. LJ668]MBW8524455.1 AIR synthase family protein [Chryseobacterium sp. LJ668]QYK15303.1 AIR synthase family protein [Chryseobacterium sp. LJ668]